MVHPFGEIAFPFGEIGAIPDEMINSHGSKTCTRYFASPWPALQGGIAPFQHKGQGHGQQQTARDTHQHPVLHHTHRLGRRGAGQKAELTGLRSVTGGGSL